VKIRVLSDLHFEFCRDGGKSFVDSLDTEGVDLLVLAGDISNAAGLAYALELMAKHFACPIVVIHGNHEFYGSDRAGVVSDTYEATRKFDHLHWLDHDVIEIAGHRILGTPMWFKEAPLAPAHLMNDFSQIGGFNRWVYEENSKALNFLNREMQEGDIVVTHYLPSEKCISQWYKGDALNAFFLCDVEKLIHDRRPALWVFGHTHDSKDFVIESTRLVCNPFGYVGHQTNREFNPNFTVELGARAARCDVCDACELERIGCPCDGSFDDGCFLCTPSRHVRPTCP
jgi:predicted phosphodiesterase